MIVREEVLRKALDAALSTGADFADIFLEDTYSSSLGLLNGKPHQAIVGQLYGAGIRLFFGHEIVYVTTNDLAEEGLIRAAVKAAQSRLGKQRILSAPLLQVVSFDSIHEYGEKPWQMDRERKFNWLRSLDQYARAKQSQVTQVQPTLIEKFQKIQVANSNGLLISDERAYVRMGIEVIAENQGVKESSHDNFGRMGTAECLDQVDLKKLAEENADRAVLLITAKYAPAGAMPVVIDNAFGGVIFHEACGHGLETTSVAKKASIFTDKLGQKIANDCVTAIDDGTIQNEWGSLQIDDEGRATQKTILIENGILKSFLVDEMGSRQTGYQVTGSGRRQSYKHAPASRMRNTYIAAGKDSFEEMIRDVDYGLYAKKMGGGSVSPGTGEFNFAATEAYIIRGGRIEEAVKGATLIGTGIDALGKIIKVSSDLKIATGMCGSVSGSIPVTVGQPQILVSSILVGGRA